MKSVGLFIVFTVFTFPLPYKSLFTRSVRVVERLALPTSDHGVAGSNPAGGEILPEPKRRFIAQSLSCSPFHRLEMTEILLKGRKTLTHPSILVYKISAQVPKLTTFSIDFSIKLPTKWYMYITTLIPRGVQRNDFERIA